MVGGTQNPRIKELGKCILLRPVSNFTMILGVGIDRQQN
jgi:hypothetical protein